MEWVDDERKRISLDEGCKERKKGKKKHQSLMMTAC